MLDLTKTISNVNDGVALASSLIPQFIAAYQMLHSIWKKDNPDMTFEQYNQRLATESQGVINFSQDWFQQHGYVKGADGNWSKPGAPPQ
jgi:hypothetical protein